MGIFRIIHPKACYVLLFFFAALKQVVIASEQSGESGLKLGAKFKF